MAHTYYNNFIHHLKRIIENEDINRCSQGYVLIKAADHTYYLDFRFNANKTEQDLHSATLVDFIQDLQSHLIHDTPFVLLCKQQSLQYEHFMKRLSQHIYNSNPLLPDNVENSRYNANQEEFHKVINIFENFLYNLDPFINIKYVNHDSTILATYLPSLLSIHNPNIYHNQLDSEEKTTLITNDLERLTRYFIEEDDHYLIQGVHNFLEKKSSILDSLNKEEQKTIFEVIKYLFVSEHWKEFSVHFNNMTKNNYTTNHDQLWQVNATPIYHIDFSKTNILKNSSSLFSDTDLITILPFISEPLNHFKPKNINDLELFPIPNSDNIKLIISGEDISATFLHGIGNIVQRMFDAYNSENIHKSHDNISEGELEQNKHYLNKVAQHCWLDMLAGKKVGKDNSPQKIKI